MLAAKRAAKNNEPPPPQTVQRPTDLPGLELKRASEIPDAPRVTASPAVSNGPSAGPSKAVSAELVPTATGASKRDPGQMVQIAQDRLRRRSLNMVRKLEELTELALKDGPVCPTCQRGMPRAEDVRLRAIMAALDRGGLSPQRTQDSPGGATGPVLVFPPGTRIAIEAAATGPVEMGVARRVDEGIVMRRADEEVGP